MNTNTSTTEPPVPFRRPMAVTRLQRDAETPFRITAEPDELVKLARYLDVDRIDRLSLAGFISPVADGGWRVRGRLVTKLEQSCVVSLEPVPARHDAEIERTYLPAEQLISEHDVLISLDDQDEPDPFIDSIDPAQLAVETLALMIDPFPRAEGAKLGSRAFAAPGVTPMTDEASRPFAGLAALKRGSGESED